MPPLQRIASGSNGSECSSISEQYRNLMPPYAASTRRSYGAGDRLTERRRDTNKSSRRVGAESIVNKPEGDLPRDDRAMTQDHRLLPDTPAAQRVNFQNTFSHGSSDELGLVTLITSFLCLGTAGHPSTTAPSPPPQPLHFQGEEKNSRRTRGDTETADVAARQNPLPRLNRPHNKSRKDNKSKCLDKKKAQIVKKASPMIFKKKVCLYPVARYPFELEHSKTKLQRNKSNQHCVKLRRKTILVEPKSAFAFRPVQPPMELQTSSRRIKM